MLGTVCSLNGELHLPAELLVAGAPVLGSGVSQSAFKSGTVSSSGTGSSPRICFVLECPSVLLVVSGNVLRIAADTELWSNFLDGNEETNPVYISLYFTFFATGPSNGAGL